MATSTPATSSAIPTRDQIAIEDTWDLGKMYATEEAWNDDLGRAPAAIQQAVSFRGRLSDGPDVARDALTAVFDLQLLITRLIVYANLRRDEDTTVTESSARYERAVMISVQAGEALSFLQPEILALPAATLAALIDAPGLATYRHILEDLERQRAHVRSAEVEEVLAQFSDVARTAHEAFGALDNADITYGEIEGADGEPIALSKARYGLLMENRDRALRQRAYETFMAAYHDHRHTLAALHGASVRKDVTAARVRGYDSALQEALADDNIPDVVYDNLLTSVRANNALFARSNALRKRMLGVDQLEVYDSRVPLSPAPDRTYAYRDAVEVVLEGVAAFGETYVNDLREGFNARWVDVHETVGKRGGAYSSGVWGAAPVILMNWNGTLSDVFTLAHEAGHSMHSFYSDRTQPFHLAGYPIFLAEIASTVNEVLLTWHLLKTDAANDPAIRFALLNRFAEGFEGTLQNQVMFADFERRTHAAVESGRPLTLEFLSATFGEVSEEYRPGLNFTETSNLNWARIPHFYRAFYVYQYATGLSAAINIARAVRDEGDSARERYLALLASGGSDYPLALLKAAGIDLTSKQPIDVAFDEYDAALTEMEAIVGSGKLELVN